MPNTHPDRAEVLGSSHGGSEREMRLIRLRLQRQIAGQSFDCGGDRGDCAGGLTQSPTWSLPLVTEWAA